MPKEYSLSVNYPNPFNPSTNIKYALPEASITRLSVFDVLGREVERLVDGVVEAGRHSITWNAADGGGRRVTSGVYFYQMQATSVNTHKMFNEVRKMVLLK